ncbi:hypothetical protein KJ742_01285 [Patescibacteria group bacterium]|nr:hypothetical protein [Patescibacteria group bacterium]MBU1682558.1 hypothetical protein [Patescibacteria group bacterium]MBU1935332.1 hypothetical protein [Patescibacteria group bacterium]
MPGTDDSQIIGPQKRPGSAPDVTYADLMDEIGESPAQQREALMVDQEWEETVKAVGPAALVIAGILLLKTLEEKEEEAEEVETQEDLEKPKADIAPFVGVDVVPAEQGELSEDQERFAKLREELTEEMGDAEFANEVAFYAQKIYENTAVPLEFGKKYSSKVTVENFDGSDRRITNNCVGFTMASLAGIPFKISAEGSNEGRYLSAYAWSGRDGYRDFIPDIVGKEKFRYERVKLDPDRVDEQVSQHLATGEYAVAAFFNHVFLIYKDMEGEVKMVHSGANVDEAGVAQGYSRANETSLSAYAVRMQRQGKPMQFEFVRLRDIVAVAKNYNNREVDEFYQAEAMPRGATTAEAVRFAEQTQGLEFMRQGAVDSQGKPYITLSRLMDRVADVSGTSMAITEVNYNWDVHQDKNFVGNRQCARTVGNILGLGGPEGAQHNWMSVTWGLVPGLIAGNLERTGHTGIIYGMENFIKGDVICYRGGEGATDYGHGRFSHVGIVRDVLTIDGEKYIAMQHNGSTRLLIDLLPLNPDQTKWKELKKKMDNPKTREEFIAQYPKLAPLYEYRSDYPQSVQVLRARPMDTSKGRGGRIAFAVRTSTLVPKRYYA